MIRNIIYIDYSTEDDYEEVDSYDDDVMMIIWPASLWGSVLPVQTGCLLYIAEWPSAPRVTAASKSKDAPAGGAVTQNKAQTHTDGSLMLLM